MIKEACPPPDTGRGRGPLAASYCAAMTQMTMGGAGVSVANGVLLNLIPGQYELELSTILRRLFV